MNLSAEQILYWSVWLFGVLYSLLRFCLTVNDVHDVLEPLDFSDGWGFLNRKKDVSDIEWAVLTDAFKKYWLLFLFHAIFSQIGYLKRNKVTLHFCSIYCLLCLILIIGPLISAFYIAYVFAMYLIHRTGRKSACYGLTVAFLFLSQQQQVVKLREAIIPEKNNGFLTDVGFVWLIARCLSFSVDRINATEHEERSIADFMTIVGYCFYLPTLFIGPLITYDSYSKQISHPQRNKPFDFKLILHLLHPVFGYFVLEFLLHYVYSSSVQFYPEIVSEFDSWSMCGLGYALPILFYLKYFTIYSFSGALSKLEQIDLPPPPKCISRINVPSLLWRTFDRGLYLWLLKYLYFPVVDGKWTCSRKVFALFLSFSFVCVWHGMDNAICAWTVLNFFNVVLEMITSFVISTQKCRQYEGTLSIANRKRMRSLIMTPLFIIMCASSCFFLSNWDIGLMVFKKILFNGWVPLLPTSFIMYCGCCVASDVKDWEESKRKLMK